MTSLRAVIGRPVLAVDGAERVGEITGATIDPDTARVVSLHVGKPSVFIPWEAIDAIGADAVMVASPSVAHPAGEGLEARLAAGETTVLGKRVLDDAGDELGAVDDVEFDDAGALTEIRVGEQSVTKDRLRGIGTYAVVVSAASD